MMRPWNEIIVMLFVFSPVWFLVGAMIYCAITDLIRDK